MTQTVLDAYSDWEDFEGVPEPVQIIVPMCSS